jgi:hypothetical protein
MITADQAHAKRSAKGELACLVSLQPLAPMWHGLVKIRRSLWGVVGTAIPLKPLSDNTFQHLKFFAGIVGFRFDSRWRQRKTPYSACNFRRFADLRITTV